MIESAVAELTRSAPPFGVAVEAAEALISLADDELIVGHRHSEWLGLSPFLEEDLVMASIAQDEFGHARALYALVWPSWSERDANVVRRPADDWRSCRLAELACPVWEDALVRHLIYDVAEDLRWRDLVLRFPEVPGLLALAEKAEQEERYHRRHAGELFRKLGVANAEANARLQASIDWLWPEALSSFGGPGGVAEDLEAALTEVCAGANLWLPECVAVASARRDRSAGFFEVQSSLLEVFAFDRDASW